ncbi:purine-cytosine permease family protein [Sulfobacillus thermosulfidooxidans]|uniref:purine-cytosine permease family protein n=1 Tax=Sulfobacillus thermosulfidooxidans TaxID=28034 RepID=UPI000406D93E|nr:cytosine permease [Sulfobacillus thermosulfidooxidans]
MSNVIGHDENLHEALTYDLAFQPVPAPMRKGPIAMSLLWLATQTTFPTMFIGFTAQQSGLPLQGLIMGCVVGTVLLSVYGILAGYLGAKTGLMQPILTRMIFGRVGMIVVSVFLVVMGIGWYSFQAVYTGQLVSGILSWTIAPTVIAVIFTVLMATNNTIGFKGVGTYGRYVAPIVFAWVLYSVIKVFTTIPSSVLWAKPHLPLTTSVIAIATLIVGSGVWGNEPDFWRFSRNKWSHVAFSMGIANVIGLFVFPITGWAMGLLAHSANPAKQSQFIVHYSLFGLLSLGALIIVVSQFALNDSNLYEAVNAVSNLFGIRRIIAVSLLVALGVVISLWMSHSSSETVFFIVAGIGASSVPTATSIMIVDTLLVPKLLGVKRPLTLVPDWHSLRWTNWIAVSALLVGVVVSIVFSIPGNVLPGIGLSLGIAPVEGWLVAVIFYIAVILVRRDNPSILRTLGYHLSESQSISQRLSGE